MSSMIRVSDRNPVLSIPERSTKTSQVLHNTKRNLIDYLEISPSNRLSFYQANQANSKLLMDSINFSHAIVSADGDANGYFTIGKGGQKIPKSAIPRINTGELAPLYADGNHLCLNSNTYYAYKGNDGRSYACAFNGRVIHRAFTEAILGNDKDHVAVECRSETTLTMMFLSKLTKGETASLQLADNRKYVKQALGNVGIQPGQFSVAIDGERKTYYLGENGKLFTEKDVWKTIEMYNTNTWFRGHSVGDTLTVFGKAYTIGEDGHIHVPTEDFWVNETCTR